MTGSPFCVVREPAPTPLCGFYAAAGTRFLELFGIAGILESTACTGMGGPACTLAIRPVARDREGDVA